MRLVRFARFIASPPPIPAHFLARNGNLLQDYAPPNHVYRTPHRPSAAQSSSNPTTVSLPPSMTSTELKAFAPLEAALPTPREGEVLTESQWVTLMAIADTIIPSIHASTDQTPNQLGIQTSEYTTSTDIIKKGIPRQQSADIARQYLDECPSSIPAFKEHVQRLLADNLRDEAQKGIRIILSALEFVFNPIEMHYLP